MTESKVDERTRAARNAQRRASERMHVAKVEWPVLVVRLRLVSPYPGEVAHWAAIKTTKKRWSRRHQLRNLVERRERESEFTERT